MDASNTLRTLPIDGDDDDDDDDVDFVAAPAVCILANGLDP